MDETLVLDCYLLLDTPIGRGRIFVLQSAECTACHYTDFVYLDMSRVDTSDNIIGTECPRCSSTNVHMTTYDKVK